MNKQIKKELDEFVKTITPEKLETMLNEIDKEQEEFMEQQSMISQIGDICKDMPTLGKALVEGYQATKADLFKNRNLRVLNCTHDDLDGAVSGIVIENVFPNVRTVQVNYKGGTEYDNAMAEILNTADTYDAIIFSDFCPDDGLVESIHKVNKPYLVIDHHPTATSRDDELGVYFIKVGQCGAMDCLEYFSPIADLSHLKTLCEVTNDHDLWFRKMVPLSDQLNNLYYEYGAANFMDKYRNGMDGYKLPAEDLALLADHDRQVDEYMATCPQKELPHNGYYIKCDKYNSDINLRLTDKYDWLVMDGGETTPGITKLSFRTKLKNLDLGQTLKALGRGGGGHPGAAGQAIPTEEVESFILTVDKALFGE